MVIDAKANGISNLSPLSILDCLVHYHEKRLRSVGTLRRRHGIFLNHVTPGAPAQNSFILAVILFSANRDTEAWKYMEYLYKELGTWKSTLILAPRWSTWVMRISERDYHNAYGAYEAAGDKFLVL